MNEQFNKEELEAILQSLKRFPGTASVEDNTLDALRNLGVRVSRLERAMGEEP